MAGGDRGTERGRNLLASLDSGDGACDLTRHKSLATVQDRQKLSKVSARTITYYSKSLCRGYF
jgi:hypothetical protein